MRAGLQAEGQMGSENVAISSPKPLRSSKTEAMSIDSYQPGDVVLVHQNVASAGIKRDEAYQIAEIVGKAIQLQNMETGNRLEINLETSRKLVGTYCVY